MPEARRWENTSTTRTSRALTDILRRLPRIWSARARARRLAPRLPILEGDVPLPAPALLESWIRDLCQTPHRRSGTPEGHRAEGWVADRFRELGLDGVTLDPIPIPVWTAARATLTVEGQPAPCFPVIHTAFTPAGGLHAPLAFVGTGTARDFARTDVRGRIAVADVPFPRMPTGLLMRGLKACYHLSDPDGQVALSTTQFLNFVRQNFIGGATSAEEAPATDVYWQAVRRGALGLCLILRDQPGNSSTHYGPYDGILKPVPALWIGRRDGTILRRQAKAGAMATMTLEGHVEPGTMSNVWGVLPGVSDEVILVTSHHDSPFLGAVEDGTGVAQVLAQAWAWSRVPRERRPRTLVFVVDAGHFHGSLGAHGFARSHPDLMARTRMLITLEHLGAREVAGTEGGYVETGRPAFTVMFTSSEPTTIATVVRALTACPPRCTAAIPSNLLAPVPTSDASGYVAEAGVPVISWIGCPYYLLDEHDTLDRINFGELQPIARTVTELVRIQMAVPGLRWTRSFGQRSGRSKRDSRLTDQR